MIPEVGQVADSVAAAALSVPGVTRLHPGAFGEVGTYLPGRRVVGVRLAATITEVHLTVAPGAEVLVIAEAVRRAVAPLVDTGVDVFVEDIEPS